MARFTPPKFHTRPSSQTESSPDQPTSAESASAQNRNGNGGQPSSTAAPEYTPPTTTATTPHVDSPPTAPASDPGPSSPTTPVRPDPSPSRSTTEPTSRGEEQHPPAPGASQSDPVDDRRPSEPQPTDTDSAARPRPTEPQRRPTDVEPARVHVEQLIEDLAEKPLRLDDAPRTATAKTKSKDSAEVTDPEGRSFHVPMPGKALRSGQEKLRRHRQLLTIGVLFVLLMAAAGGGLLGVGLIANSDDRSAPITPEEARKYGLDDYNVDAAMGLISPYLRLCLNRTENSKYPADREDQLKRMASVNDPACNVSSGSSEEKSPVRTVGLVEFAGQTSPVEGITGARYVSVSVIAVDGSTSWWVVPVYLSDPITGAGPRVIGNIGIIPAPRPGAPNPSETPPETDEDLAGQLSASFLPEFMTAWSGSTATLPQFLAPAATEPAKTGLYGALTNVEVDAVTVHPPESAIADNGEITYIDGDRVTATVTITAQSGGIPTAAAYRLTLERSGAHWFVVDIAGATAVPGDGNSVEPPPANTPSPTAEPTG